MYNNTKKALVILSLVLSPLISLVALTPISIIPAIVLAKYLTRKECAGIQGESLCGFGQATIYTFILNALLGLLTTITIVLITNKNWGVGKKVLISFILASYFLIITSIFFVYSLAGK